VLKAGDRRESEGKDRKTGKEKKAVDQALVSLYGTTSRKPTPFRGGMKAVLVLISMPILDTLGLALWQLDVGRCGEKVPT
jgi:hypothetical protein